MLRYERSEPRSTGEKAPQDEAEWIAPPATGALFDLHTKHALKRLARVLLHMA